MFQAASKICRNSPKHVHDTQNASKQRPRNVRESPKRFQDGLGWPLIHHVKSLTPRTRMTCTIVRSFAVITFISHYNARPDCADIIFLLPWGREFPMCFQDVSQTPPNGFQYTSWCQGVWNVHDGAFESVFESIL